MSELGKSRHPIRSFTNEGLQKFQAWLDRAETAETKRFTAEPPPEHLLFDKQYATEIGYGGYTNQRRFERKYDMGFEVCKAVDREEMLRLMGDASAWAWLSLYFHESTVPFKKGKWFTGDRSRHLVGTIANRRQDQSQRHLVKGAATNVFRFSEYAAVLMSGASGMSKIEEQIMSRKVDPPLAFLPELVKALHKLYWDVDADDVRVGAAGDGSGSIMHFVDLIGQLDLTYDISHLKSERLIVLLPNAFKRFKTGSGSRRSRRRIRPTRFSEAQATA